MKNFILTKVIVKAIIGTADISVGSRMQYVEWLAGCVLKPLSNLETSVFADLRI
jgi:hypothetical protein